MAKSYTALYQVQAYKMKLKTLIILTFAIALLLRVHTAPLPQGGFIKSLKKITSIGKSSSGENSASAAQDLERSVPHAPPSPPSSEHPSAVQPPTPPPSVPSTPHIPADPNIHFGSTLPPASRAEEPYIPVQYTGPDGVWGHRGGYDGHGAIVPDSTFGTYQGRAGYGSAGPYHGGYGDQYRPYIPQDPPGERVRQDEERRYWYQQYGSR